jgi:hypothetical protein
MLCAEAFAQCSLYGPGTNNIKDSVQSDEIALPLILRRFSEKAIAQSEKTKITERAQR